MFRTQFHDFWVLDSSHSSMEVCKLTLTLSNIDIVSGQDGMLNVFRASSTGFSLFHEKFLLPYDLILQRRPQPRWIDGTMLQVAFMKVLEGFWDRRLPSILINYWYIKLHCKSAITTWSLSEGPNKLHVFWKRKKYLSFALQITGIGDNG